MATRLIDSIIYSSILVAATSLVLSLVPLNILNKDIEIYRISLIFFGTLFVYNLDHLIDVQSDKKITPGRTEFISSNKLWLKSITIISAVIAGILFFKQKTGQNLVLIPAFVFGLLHWKFKNWKLFSAVYITVSWLLVVIIYPLSDKIYINRGIMFILSVTGLCLLSNAWVYMADDVRKINKYRIVYYSKYLTSLALIIAMLSPSNIKFIAFLPGLTLLALFNYREGKRFALLYLDGALLAGGLLCILADKLFNHLIH